MSILAREPQTSNSRALPQQCRHGTPVAKRCFECQMEAAPRPARAEDLQQHQVLVDELIAAVSFCSPEAIARARAALLASLRGAVPEPSPELATGIEWLKQEIADGEAYLESYPDSVPELEQQSSRRSLLAAITQLTPKSAAGEPSLSAAP